VGFVSDCRQCLVQPWTLDPQQSLEPGVPNCRVRRQFDRFGLPLPPYQPRRVQEWQVLVMNLDQCRLSVYDAGLTVLDQ
jgi:hypothetical protein